MSLDFRSPASNSLAAHSTRRAALRVGALGLMGGFGIDQLASLRAAQSDEDQRPVKAKSVIYIFLSGGLSQIDSFDMKPNAPSDIRGEFNPISTRTPGLQICEHLPELAKRSDQWAICRSLSHGSNEHSDGHMIMMTGRTSLPSGFDRSKPKESDWPSIASLAGNLLPSQNPLLPPAMVLPEKMIHRSGRVIPGQFGGLLGKHYDPFFLETSKFNSKSYGAYPEYLFHHADGKIDDENMKFRALSLELPDSVDFERFSDRLQLMKHLDRQQAHLESASQTREMNRYQQMAVSLLADEKTKGAFDVDRADPKLKQRYGENAFGWSLLMARQLVEAGVSLVQVNLGNNECWDTHQAGFPNLKDYLFPPTDRAVSALLDDLQERGMLDDTLVVMASEFGRTPKITRIPSGKLPGRDHWGAVQTVWMAGGGVTGGAVLGSTDKLGGHPTSDGRRAEDFAATIFDSLGIPQGSYWHDVVGRPMPLYHGKPMTELFS